ncbi:MAG: prepilin-type N-terminal cleavage/methylation domain-containing protein [bacterium]|nr:prepilin-type N-terminal cleavage/methylation domain-containing protein [bacterium]
MKNKHGFTMIEAMISMVVLAVVLIIVFVFLRAGLQHWIGGKSIIDVQNTAREIVSGKGNWRGMEGELRELSGILNAKPNPTDNLFYLLKDKIRFVGPVSIVNGADTICSTYFFSNDIQAIATGTIALQNYSGVTLITPGTDSLLQSIPGDINGDGTLTAAERDSSDDYARGGFMAGGGDAVIITDSNAVCNTRDRGDDVPVIAVGNTAGRGAILITPGPNGKLESVPGDTDGDGVTDVQNSNNFISSAVISYEYLPETNTIIRKINDTAPASRHLGPSVIAENVATFTLTYYGTDSTTIIPYGTYTQLPSIGLIEIQGTVSTEKKGGIGQSASRTVTYDTATFKTRIQPRALNPAYRR